MGRNVADLMWEMLEKAGVERCYGIVGDALKPVVDALHRNGHIEFVHVRHEENGVFAAVADAYLTGKPVVVCGTAERAGPLLLQVFVITQTHRESNDSIARQLERENKQQTAHTDVDT